MDEFKSVLDGFRAWGESRYGADFLFEVSEVDRTHTILVLPESVKEKLLQLLIQYSDFAVKIKSVEKDADHFYLINFVDKTQSQANLYTKREEDQKYLADQLMGGELIGVVGEPLNGEWTPVVVYHDFEKLAPFQLGWLKFNQGWQKIDAPFNNKGQNEFSFKAIQDKIEEFQKTYPDVAYLLGGKSKDGFDCSGFVQYIYWKVRGRILPRLSRWEALIGREIAPDQVQAGDVVYFDDLEKMQVGHIGFVTEVLDSKPKKVLSYTRFENGLVEEAIDSKIWEERELKVAGFRRFE